MTEIHTGAAAKLALQPFDPKLPGQIRAYIDAWKADGGATYVSQGFFRDGTSQRLTVAQLEELLERDAYAEKTRLELAEACARLRQERNDALQQSAARLALLEQAANDGLALAEQRDVLYDTLRQVLGSPWENGHPGYAAMRTFWIYADTVKKWKAVLASIPQPERPADLREVPEAGDAIARFRRLFEIADGLAAWMTISTTTAKAILEALPEPGDVTGVDENATPALGGCPRCRRRVPLEHFDAIASHCVEGTASECTGTGLAPVDLAAPTHSTSAELQPPDVWCVRYGIEIRDPDGWRTPDAPSWEMPITLAEFQVRAAKSTARPVSPRTLGQIHAQMSADRRGERGKD